MRIGLSLVVLIDLFFRLSNKQAFYDNNGIWPLSAALTHLAPGSWSIYFLNASPIFFDVGCFIHAGLLVLLLVGWHTKFITPLVWIMTYSLQQRNPYINQGGDALVLILLLCACFLPWGARLSFDEKHQRSAINSSVAHVFLLFSVAVMYLFTVLLKQAPEWQWDGSAIEKTLQLHQLRSRLGTWLLTQPNLMQMLTWIVLAVEGLLPLFLLNPFSSKQSRKAAFYLITGLHLGFALFLRVGIFPFINIVFALSLLQPKEHTPAPTSRLSLPSLLMLFLAVLFTLLINFSTLPNWPYRLNQTSLAVANGLGLQQDWGMFSPGIPRTDGWYTSQLMKRNGNYSEEKNELSRTQIDVPLLDDRWRKFSENMQRPGRSFLLTNYCYYLLKKFNKNSNPDPSTVHFLYFHQVNYNNNGTPTVSPPTLASACHE